MAERLQMAAVKWCGLFVVVATLIADPMQFMSTTADVFSAVGEFGVAVMSGGDR